jgi:RNA polymerase sigma-70 factor (ECF subfamily)
MSEPTDDFASLIERSRQGDRTALARLVEQYEFKIRLVARHRLGPALRPYLDSVDLTQSVHRSLILGLRQNKFEISSPKNLIALALTMVRRKVARQWRHLQRQKRFDPGSASEGALPDVLTSLSSTQADPTRAAQFNDQVHQLCQSLEKTDRRLLELRLQDYSLAEVAGQLGITVNALRVRLHRLRLRLRDRGVLDDWL